MSNLLQIAPQKSKIYRFLSYIKAPDNKYIQDKFDDKTWEKLSFTRMPWILKWEDGIYREYCLKNNLIKFVNEENVLNNGTFEKMMAHYKLTEDGEVLLLRYKWCSWKIEMFCSDYPWFITILLSLSSGTLGVIIGLLITNN